MDHRIKNGTILWMYDKEVCIGHFHGKGRRAMQTQELRPGRHAATTEHHNTFHSTFAFPCCAAQPTVRIEWNAGEGEYHQYKPQYPGRENEGTYHPPEGVRDDNGRKQYKTRSQSCSAIVGGGSCWLSVVRAWSFARLKTNN
jgi:hypothetical protein